MIWLVRVYYNNAAKIIVEIKKEWDKLTPEERARIVSTVDDLKIDVTE